MRQNVTLCFLGFVTYYFSKKKNCCVCFVCLILFIRIHSILFLLFCCFLLFFEIYSIFISFLLLKLIFTSGIIIIIQNVTYWYNYCFSKAVVIGDNHNHNHNHKCYNVYLFIYLSTQRTPCKYGPVGTAPPPASGPCSPMSCSLDHAMTGFQC